MSELYESVLNAARQLPLVEQQLLAHRLLDQKVATMPQVTESQQAALAVVEQLRGTIKGLDRETVQWLAEDEELCGY